MIKTEDRKMWDGSGIANCFTKEWKNPSTLVLNFDMQAELIDKTTGAKFRIDSSRQVSIHFTGLKGKVMEDQPPEYEKQPEP